MSINHNNNTVHNPNANLSAAATSRIADNIAHNSADNNLPAPTADTDIDIDTNNIDSVTAASINKQGHVGHLELLEERPVVNKERLDVGKVMITKHSRTKTIEVPIELVEEYITIQTDYNDAESQDLLSGNYDDKDILRHVEPSLGSTAVVTINGKQVTIGDAPVEIILSRQVATITKDTYAVQEVAVSKTTHTHTDTIQVELQHEELDVREEGFLEHDKPRNYKK